MPLSTDIRTWASRTALPEAWPQDAPAQQATRAQIGIVVSGDSHLSAYLPRLTPQRRAERRAYLRRGFQAAVDYAIEHHARLFLQLGDLFDTPSPSNEDRAFVASCLERLRYAGILAAGIGGNHDTPRMRTEHGGEAPQAVYAASGGMVYFPERHIVRPRLIEVAGLRLALAGLTNDPVAAPGSDPLAHVQIEDPGGVLAQADVGILMLHAGIEGLCFPNEGERIATRASLDALPAAFSIIVSGHIHRYAFEKAQERTLIVSGATERMELGTASGSAGFVWLRLGEQVRARHITIEEQPRADVLVSTSHLWPVAFPEAAESQAPAGSLWQSPLAEPDPLDRLKARLAEFCTPETLVRLRLAGPLTLDQYHELALREILLYGNERAFSLELDTRGLRLIDSRSQSPIQGEGVGPVSPVREVHRLLEERLDAAAHDDPDWADSQRAAAELLIARLRGTEESEAGT